MFLDQVPAHHVDELSEILLDLFHRELALVDRVEPVLQESLRHHERGLLEQELVHVDREEESALACEVALDLARDILLELLGRLHAAVRESRLEKLLVQLGFGELADLRDRETVVRVHAFELGFLHA